MLTASDGAADDRYAVSVSISGDTIVVGAFEDDVGANNKQGSAYVYNYHYTANFPPTIITDDDITAEEDSFYYVNYDVNDLNIEDTFTWSISYTDTDGWLTMDSGAGVLSGTPDNSDVGEWIVCVTVHDGNGGSHSSNFTLTVSNVNDDPVISTTDVSTTTEDVLYSVDYDATDIDPTEDTLNWSVNTNATWLTIDTSTGILFGTPTNDDVGSYLVSVSVSDGNGGADYDNFTLTVSNVNDDPVISTEDVTTAIEDLFYSVEYDAIDIDPTGDTLTWSVNTNALWLVMDPTTGILSGTPTNADVGDFWVSVSVSDGNGGSNYSNFTLTVMNVNDNPIISTTNMITAIEDLQYSVDYNAVDLDLTGDTLTWSVFTNASWLTINPATGGLSGTPANNNVGIHWVNVSVSDGNDGSDYSNFILTVLNVNDAPVISTDDVTTATEDIQYSVDYEATDIDPTRDTLTWSVITNASWLTITSTTGVMSGAPTNADVGIYEVSVSVSDGNGGRDYNNFTLTVLNVNDDPVISTTAMINATVNLLYIFDYNATDIDPTGDTLTWSLDTNASWLTINPITGILSGTPTKTNVGTFLVSISVSDGNGGNDYSNFTITVRSETGEKEKEVSTNIALFVGMAVVILIMVIVAVLIMTKKLPMPFFKKEDEGLRSDDNIKGGQRKIQ